MKIQCRLRKGKFLHGSSVRFPTYCYLDYIGEVSVLLTSVQRENVVIIYETLRTFVKARWEVKEWSDKEKISYTEALLLLSARVDYIMCNPITFLNVDFIYDSSRWGIWGKSLS